MWSYDCWHKGDKHPAEFTISVPFIDLNKEVKEPLLIDSFLNTCGVHAAAGLKDLRKHISEVYDVSV